jgi:hypothetical protein
MGKRKVIVATEKREDAKTNPYGANQYMYDPRQAACWEYYVNPKSETFANGMQSAIKAGYEPEYANQITTTTWFKEKIRRMNLLGKAEKVLDETLQLPRHIDADGKVDSGIERVRLDAAKFVADRVGKHDGWSQKQEVEVTTPEEELTEDELVQRLNKLKPNDSKAK